MKEDGVDFEAICLADFSLLRGEALFKRKNKRLRKVFSDLLLLKIFSQRSQKGKIYSQGLLPDSGIKKVARVSYLKCDSLRVRLPPY